MAYYSYNYFTTDDKKRLINIPNNDIQLGITQLPPFGFH